MRHKGAIYSGGLGILILFLAAANLLLGSVDIPPADVVRILLGGDSGKDTWDFIVWESRFPQCVTALLCGASLATVVVGAFVGAVGVLGIILLLSTVIKNNVMLLIAGIMIGYVASSLISLLNFFSSAEGIRSYTIWGLGNFGGVSLEQLPAFALTSIAGLLVALLLIKPLNALLLGPRYAENLGVNIRRVRNLLLAATGILTAVTTAFCGPVSFIGLAVPHIARLLLGTSNHNLLMPVTLLVGGAVALLCNLLCMLPGEHGLIPLNAVTPILGAPVIIYVIVNQRKIQYFN